MALRFLLPPPQNLLQRRRPLKSKPQYRHTFPSVSIAGNASETLTLIASCITNDEAFGGSVELPPDLTAEAAKMSSHLTQRAEAMRKSRELLFAELCRHLSARSEEVKGIWGTMTEEERWVLVRGFVSQWSVDFHPLSARSVKEMVEEHLEQEFKVAPSDPVPNSYSSTLLCGLKNMILGFSARKSSI